VSLVACAWPARWAMRWAMRVPTAAELAYERVGAFPRRVQDETRAFNQRRHLGDS